MPPLLFLLCVGAATALHYWRPAPIANYPFGAGLALGSLLMLAAALLGFFAFREMQRHHTTVIPGQIPTSLVTTGPFAHTRNPLYVANVSVALSLAVMVNSLWHLGAAVVLAVLIDRLVITREEKVIAREFGEEYARYKGRVRRWL